uniref:Uncharacterized protein n=1 Tax=Oryza brachyantha TaxID=4533 RepID=J3N8Y4_ORYBR
MPRFYRWKLSNWKELREIFDSWDHEKDRKPCDPSGSTKFTDLISCLVDKKDGRRPASGVVKSILQMLHLSQAPLHFEFNGETLEQQTVVRPRLLGCICLTHELFGLHIYENRCNCVNEVETKFEYHIDLGIVGKTKLESFSELLKAMESRTGSCGQEVARYSLLYPPHLFMTVFEWKGIEESYINMHKVLISLAAKLDISHIYGGLLSGCMYTLVSASAGSWQESLQRYSQANLHPEILFFERIISGRDQTAP